MNDQDTHGTTTAPVCAKCEDYICQSFTALSVRGCYDRKTLCSICQRKAVVVITWKGKPADK